MSVIINCSAYMALVYEVTAAFLVMVQMIKFAKIMKFDMLDVTIILQSMCKLITFGFLAVGVIGRYRFAIRLWLVVAYLQIKWQSVIDVSILIYEYYFSEHNKSKQEFFTELSDVYGPIIGQVLTRIGIILIVYRFFKSLEPKKTRLYGVQPEQKADELKSK
ncbi:uncharacterized protein LOC6583385 [Drosophila mojavensis]|uniref:Uncharacterized protein n=1 Tax=Drosophila mojavensis TaxID=7230 RepID=B4KVY0_DROMO|nr:uncharacterized protein LOC6583385 [Drosophila mojavensis]EDW19531.2 uncharacterized protein Dmoj_GI11475 [Drosophila mojavensis]